MADDLIGPHRRRGQPHDTGTARDRHIEQRTIDRGAHPAVGADTALERDQHLGAIVVVLDARDGLRGLVTLGHDPTIARDECEADSHLPPQSLHRRLPGGGISGEHLGDQVRLALAESC